MFCSGAAEFELWLPEEGRFTGDGDVARHHQFKCTGETRSSYARNGRLRASPKAHDDVKILLQQWAPLRHTGRPPLHLLLKIEAG